MNFNLNGKVALVTGGSRGIGKSIAVALANEGCNVAFTFRSAEAQAKVVEQQIISLGKEAKCFQANVASSSETKNVVDAVVAQFKRLDILVNSAGITKDGLLMRMKEEDFDDVIDTNLKGVFNYTQAASKQMMSQRAGKIVNITSVVGVTGNAGQSNYAASKAGIIGFTKSIAKELASRNIQVNAIAPGFIETEMTGTLTDEQKKIILEKIPAKRIAKPEEIASVVCFLASSNADYITGQTICVDGGMVM
ncbi:MAG: 3-oxoacyl-[acyl-carrier-protein] reductase [Ignavibacteriales bacterium]|nr:3-oxoacyl-[acyl-carrier-protein] reductase [Ignavibacteriales bacterium]